jgi:protein MpaA
VRLALFAAAILLGRSYEGRPIEAIHVRGRGAPVLVVGCIHGDECAGIRLVRELARRGGCHLWLVPNLNPDGYAAGTRANARSVDLNRNFATATERETRIAMKLIERVRPAETIWFHQYYGAREFVRAWGPSVPAGRDYARRAGLSFRRLPWPPGSATRWQNRRFPGTTAFVVELPRGPVSQLAIRRHSRSVCR